MKSDIFQNDIKLLYAPRNHKNKAWLSNGSAKFSCELICLCGFLDRDTWIPHHGPNTIQETFKVHIKEPKTLAWPPDSKDPNQMDHSKDATQPRLEQRPHPQLIRPQRSVASVLVSSSTGHPHRCPVHVLTGQNCFGAMKG